MTSPPAWRVPLADLAWLEDDGEYVVYQAVSGATHRLDPASGLVFAAGLVAPVSEAALRDSLALRWGVAAQDIDMDAIRRTILRLQDVGLFVAEAA